MPCCQARLTGCTFETYSNATAATVTSVSARARTNGTSSRKRVQSGYEGKVEAVPAGVGTMLAFIEPTQVHNVPAHAGAAHWTGGVSRSNVALQLSTPHRRWLSAWRALARKPTFASRVGRVAAAE